MRSEVQAGMRIRDNSGQPKLAFLLGQTEGKVLLALASTLAILKNLKNIFISYQKN
jgi:hypothetical protein